MVAGHRKNPAGEIYLVVQLLQPAGHTHGFDVPWQFDWNLLFHFSHDCASDKRLRASFWNPLPLRTCWMWKVASPSTPASFVRTPCLAVRSEYIHTFFSTIRPLKLSEESSASQLSGAILFKLPSYGPGVLVFGVLCRHTASNSIASQTHTSGAQ